MPLPIQAGDSANKARAFFDLRGRIPLIFDETIVPVAVVGDLNIPGIVLPRQGEYQAFELNQAAGAAGEFSHIIFGPTPGSRETFVVRYFTVGSTSNTLTRVRLGKTTVDLVLATLGFDLNSGQTGMALEAIIQPDGTLPGGRIVSGSGVVAGTFANPFRLPLKIEGAEGAPTRAVAVLD